MAEKPSATNAPAESTPEQREDLGQKNAEASAPQRRVFDPKTETAPVEQAPKPAVESAPQVTQQDFAALLNEQGGVAPVFFEPGERVTGRIIDIGAENIFIDLGGKAEAFLPIAEISEEEERAGLAVGNSISAIFVRGEAGALRLGRKLSGGSDLALVEAYESGLEVSGVVDSVIKGGYEVTVFGQRAFCPLSQIELAYTEDPSQHLGRSYGFKIIEFSQNGKRVVLSRAALQKAEAEEKAKELRQHLAVGQVVEGTVRSLQNYGAFVDLGGLDGLVHISEIAFNRLEHPSEALKEGQAVKVKILSIEQTKKGERISLSIKQAEGDPWEDAHTWLEVGAKLTGRVVRLANFGAFVALKPGVEGLVHISEMSWEKRIRHPSDVLSEGDEISVSVVNVDLDQRRVGLSMKSAGDDPWSKVEDRYNIGQEIEGEVESVVDFGVFVRLEPGLTGLLPLSELGTKPGTPPSKDFRAGDQVKARIIAIEPDRRRLTFSRKEGSSGGGGGGDKAQPSRRPRREPRAPREYTESDGGFATLGDLLNNQLRKKK